MAQGIVSEADLLNAVLDLAKVLGWRCAHFRPAMTMRGYRTPVQADGKGWPDLTLVKGGRLVFAELKSAIGKLTPEQSSWQGALTAVPCAEFYIWRPDDMQEIARILQR